MNRLTKTYRDKTYKIFGVADDLPCGENSYDFKNLLIQKLGEYEDLEEQGLLMRLPCKPYAKVYEIYTKYDEKEDNYVRGIEELLLMRFGKTQYFEYAILKREDGEDSVTLEQFGKTVFLTREEAEKALNKEE